MAWEIAIDGDGQFKMQSSTTAAILVIGDEILSGQTKDRNVGFLADTLSDLGIDLEEVRIVADRKEAIIEAVQALSAKYDRVFTTGGIGPTHDDITADAIAEAFGAELRVDDRALAIMNDFYASTGSAMTRARMRMARIPVGADLIENPVSAAPGFHIKNVYVMAGIPAIMQAMFDSLAPKLPAGAVIQKETIEAGRGESLVSEMLERIQDDHPDVRIGSYPYHDGERPTTRIVIRSRNAGALAKATAAVRGGLETAATKS